MAESGDSVEGRFINPSARNDSDQGDGFGKVHGYGGHGCSPPAPRQPRLRCGGGSVAWAAWWGAWCGGGARARALQWAAGSRCGQRVSSVEGAPASTALRLRERKDSRGLRVLECALWAPAGRCAEPQGALTGRCKSVQWWAGDKRTVTDVWERSEGSRSPSRLTEECIT